MAAVASSGRSPLPRTYRGPEALVCCICFIFDEVHSHANQASHPLGFDLPDVRPLVIFGRGAEPAMGSSIRLISRTRLVSLSPKTWERLRDQSAVGRAAWTNIPTFLFGPSTS